MYYENISIQSGPAVMTERQFYEKSESNCLIQILYTLVSILPGDKINEYELLNGHFGYVSIGKIFTAGKEIPFSEGQCVLLPPVFSKYIVLDASCDPFQLPYKIPPISIDIDGVKSLFIPVLCIAFHLLDQIKESYEEHKQVLIFGYTLMAEVLHRVLIMNNIDAVIIDDYSSGKYRKCIYSINYLKNMEPSKIGQVVVFNLKSFHTSLLKEKLKDIKVTWIEVPPFPQASKQYVRYDLFVESIDFLKHNDTLLQKLVVQHVHAESICQTCRTIEQYRFYGPCIVYDW